MNDEHDRATAQSGDPHDPAAISRRRFLSTVGAGVGAAATIGGLSGYALASEREATATAPISTTVPFF